jgi:hypothetical protein
MMKASLARRTFILLPLACAALYGCPQSEETHDEGEEYADVVYEGEATDEGMVALGSALDQKAPVEDATRAPELHTTETQLPKSPIPTFGWHIGQEGARAPLPFTAPQKALSLLPPASGPVVAPGSDALREIRALFGPIRAASAHGEPMNGAATFLVFSTKSDPKLVRVLTDQLSYTPSQEAWDKLVGAKTEITLSLIGATFDANRIADGGDPVQGSELKFTITP